MPTRAMADSSSVRGIDRRGSGVWLRTASAIAISRAKPMPRTPNTRTASRKVTWRHDCRCRPKAHTARALAGMPNATQPTSPGTRASGTRPSNMRR